MLSRNGTYYGKPIECDFCTYKKYLAKRKPQSFFRGNCAACKKPIAKNKGLWHHVSYFPEKVLPVHHDCHDKIHKKPKSEYPDLTPPKGDSLVFYKILGMMQGSEHKCPICEKITNIDYLLFHRCVYCGYIPQLEKVVL